MHWIGVWGRKWSSLFRVQLQFSYIASEFLLCDIRSVVVVSPLFSIIYLVSQFVRLYACTKAKHKNAIRKHKRTCTNSRVQQKTCQHTTMRLSIARVRNRVERIGREKSRRACWLGSFWTQVLKLNGMRETCETTPTLKLLGLASDSGFWPLSTWCSLCNTAQNLYTREIIQCVCAFCPLGSSFEEE